MHEMAITQSILDICKEEMVSHQASRLLKVRLRVGELTVIEPSSLCFCFEVLTKGTELEGAVLQIERVPIKALCSQCKSKFEVLNLTLLCPFCGSKEIEIISGKELDLMDMEVK